MAVFTTLSVLLSVGFFNTSPELCAVEYWTNSSRTVSYLRDEVQVKMIYKTKLCFFPPKF